MFGGRGGSRARPGDSPAAGAAAISAVAGTAGAAVALALGTTTRRWLGPVQVTARTRFAASGGTALDLPPLGVATVATHRGPLQVRVQASGVDPARAPGLLAMPADAEHARDLQAQLHTVLAALAGDARRLGAQLAARTVAAALGGGALAGALVAGPPDRARAARTGGAAAAATLAVSAAVAAATLDRNAWRDPQLTGLLTKAPLVLGDLRTAPERVDTYRYQLADLVRTVTGVYQRVISLPEPPPEDAIRLLHISDIHLSPLAHPLARALIDQFTVDAVVDTGDLVDWGTPAEQIFATQIADLPVPYVFVKGNHDSAGIAAAVAALPNATVLDAGDAPVEIAGLRFAGLADPRFTPDKTTGDDHAEHRVSEAARDFAEAIRGQGVDIALAHDPAAGRALDGVVPLLLAGHTHKRSVRRFGDLTVLVQGTSGGSGLRGVQDDPPAPLSLSVVYLDRSTKRLWGMDEVTLGGIGSVTVSVERRTAAELLGEA